MRTIYARQAPGLGFIPTDTLEQIAQAQGQDAAARWAAENMPDWAIAAAAEQAPWLPAAVERAKQQIAQERAEAARKALEAIEEHKRQEQQGTAPGIPTWALVVGGGAILYLLAKR